MMKMKIYHMEKVHSKHLPRFKAMNLEQNIPDWVPLPMINTSLSTEFPSANRFVHPRYTAWMGESPVVAIVL